MNKQVAFEQRNLWLMLFLLIVTCGFYYLYWLYKTKNEINSVGGKIPTLWLAIIPFANIYFDYRYAQDFVKYIRHSEETIDAIVYFLLLIFLPGISAFVIQYQLNKYSEHK